jgi:plastocyanin
MTRRLGQALALIGLVSALASCGGSSSGSGGGSGTVNNGATGFYITISGMAFSPLQLAVPPGATVTVVNQDGIPHSVTSEDAPGNYTLGSVSGVQFDTGLFVSQANFTIPANAPAGAIIPFFCKNHKQTMVTPTGTIRIDSSAQPGPAPVTGGGGSGGGGMGGGGY